jgi:glycosyltransferase involved in cell wall biosynthesis
MTCVDIVVPCYRYGHFLTECVESVLNQTGVEVRVLIIDDASPDNSAEVAADLSKKDSRVSFVRHASNKGHIATYNEGIEWASATYYMILSADDYLLPGALYRSARLMDAHPSVGLTFGQAITLNDSDTAAPIPSQNGSANWKILSGPDFIKTSGAKNIVPTPTAVVRTELQKRIGGYRQELPHSGDMEMWLRLAAHGQVGIVDAYQAIYRRHATNMSSLYYANMWLPDIQQRREAIECFVRTCKDVIPGAAQIHDRLLKLLSIEAVNYAGSAYNDGELELSLQLSDFATSIYPRIKRSVLWMKLASKRRFDPQVWNVLRSPISWVRQLVKSDL